MKVLRVIFVLNLFCIINALKENCTSEQDCSTHEKSVCLDEICQCDPSSKYNEKEGKCVKYATEFGAICYEASQCKPFLGDNSECLNNICVCANDYRWYQGKCQKFAKKNEACSAELKCLDPTNPLALTCTSKTCQCSDGYYDRGGDCRLGSGVDKECAIDSDCLPSNDTFYVPNVFSHCELGKCVRNAKKQRLISLNDFVDSEFYSGIMTLEGVGPNNTACSAVSSEATKEECEKCPNTFYFLNSTCICKPGFFLDNNKCVAELGMLDTTTSYTSDADCPIKPGKLVDGVCYCKNYWFQGGTNRECKKTTLQYTQNCMDNDWCKAMGEYAYCHSETGKCQCVSQAVLNKTTFYCNLKEDYNLTGICLSDSDCALYETCLDEKCQCTDGFFKVDDSGVCLPKIGHSCEVRDCSHINNAICSENEVCECNGDADEYVTDGKICAKMATELNEECQISKQCKNVSFSSCIKESNTSSNAISRCLCVDEYLAVNGTCHAIKYPGSLCDTESDCTIILGDTFECRNMLCQCPLGKTLNKDNICTNSGSSPIRTSNAVLLAVLIGILIRMP